MSNNLRRDHMTNAIINTDRTSYEQYLIAKNNAMSNVQLTNKVNSLESDMKEIKSLLLKLLDK